MKGAQNNEGDRSRSPQSVKPANTEQVLRCCNATMERASKVSYAVISMIRPRWFGGETAWRKEGADGCKENVRFELPAVTFTFFSQSSYRDLLIATSHSRELSSLLNYAWLSFTPPIEWSISSAWWPYHLWPVENTHFNTTRDRIQWHSSKFHVNWHWNYHSNRWIINPSSR